MSVVSAESSNADDESLLEGTSSAAGAPLWAFVLGGFLPVPVVYVTFVRLQSAWGAALALEAAFVLVPAAICAVWPETRKRVAAAARQAMGGSGGQQLSLRAQLLAAVALGGATLVGAALAILLFEHFFASEWSHATRQVRAHPPLPQPQPQPQPPPPPPLSTSLSTLLSPHLRPCAGAARGAHLRLLAQRRAGRRSLRRVVLRGSHPPLERSSSGHK